MTPPLWCVHTLVNNNMVRKYLARHKRSGDECPVHAGECSELSDPRHCGQRFPFMLHPKRKPQASRRPSVTVYRLASRSSLLVVARLNFSPQLVLTA
jgi:hypothetical protein